MKYFRTSGLTRSSHSFLLSHHTPHSNYRNPLLCHSLQNTPKLQFPLRNYTQREENFRVTHHHQNELAAKDTIRHNKDKHRGEWNEKDTVLEFSVVPVGIKTDSLAQFVGICGRTLQTTGLHFEVNAMGAMVEGPLDACLEAVKDCVRASLTHTPRTLVNIRLDVRPGVENRIHKKKSLITEIERNVVGGVEKV